MKAVIIAGGRGVRMRHLTEDKPKAMVEINGRPLIYYLIDNLKASGVTDIAIVVGYKQEVIKDYFGDQFTYFDQGVPLGTAHAMLCAESFTGNEPFILANGDSLWHTEDIRKMFGSRTKMAVIETDTPELYGVIVMKDGKFDHVSEKPKREEAPSNLANTALYTFTPEIYSYLKKIEQGPKGEYVFLMPPELNPEIIYLEHGWLDVGCPEHIPIAEKRLHEFI